MNELVSIIMPSYNTANLILESIQSVLNQTYTNWELIIVDDCSTDNTEEVVKSINDDRIRFIKKEQNSGAAESRNFALREAKGRWIAFLDSDDLWKKDKLQKQIQFMEDNGYAFSYTDYEEIDAEGNRLGVLVTGPDRVTKRGMYRYCWLGCLTVMYDMTKIGLIQIKNIRKNNDYAMWLKVCKKADCYRLNENLAYYRKGRGGSISTHSKWKLIKWHYRLFHYADEKNPISSCFCTMRNMVFGFYKKKKYIKQQVD
ncbi:MAG: glycosyltransferase [Lachnospiraceae bacterium]|nr:glycosyltransferase [Lachnospiraceae bacterium]